jgi:hypothetical protein
MRITGLAMTVALAASAFSLSCCTALGYAVGEVMDASLRESVPAGRWKDLSHGTYIWITSLDGTHHRGRLTAEISQSDSLIVLKHKVRSSLWGPPVVVFDTIAIQEVDSLEVDSRRCRWTMTPIGVVADIALFVYVNNVLSGPGPF